MESHNHPSFIEPYQAAATGVGGILRDVFTMGARPVAALNLLRFGAPEHPKTWRLVAGVVAGIGRIWRFVRRADGRRSSTGFHRRYDGNILVNAMAVGVAKRDDLHLGCDRHRQSDRLSRLQDRARWHPLRQHGPAAFEADAEEKRPTVQVGDPFAEKLLLEACLGHGLGRGDRHSGHGRRRPASSAADGGQGRSQSTSTSTMCRAVRPA
jgi:phosphoribosylformylglycinamidine synthase